MKELRIGLVLYGGVSLAIYMNGISTELWHLLRASRARADRTTADLDDHAGLYAKLLDELQRITGDDLRVVVDAIAGTSAGGVNGAVLAKAIVEGGDASILHDVWLDKADISELRAKPAARAPWYVRAGVGFLACVVPRLRSLKADIGGLPGISWEWVRDHVYSMFVEPDGRSTMLDGDYFTAMIARTLADLGTGQALLPDRAGFDLFLTRTDLHGWPRHLPVTRALHPTPLYERTHAHVMHFRRRPGGAGLGDDFGLTYATRSTASFPLAFAPVDYETTRASYANTRPGDRIPDQPDFARRHLPEHRLFGFPADGAWMVDGGVLDNKPFTHVTRAIERKPAEHEVHRVVVYVEPDPEATPEPAEDRTIPPPLQVARNLYRLFRHEPIHEDLRLLRQRNARVADIASVLKANAEDALRAARLAGRRAELAYPPAPGDADRWRRAANAYAAADSLPGYPGYVVLKARSATAVLADVVCRALGYPYDSRHAYFVRRLVSTWIDRRSALAAPERRGDEGFVLNEDQRLLLSAFDVPFRLRRLRALARATNELYDPTRHADRTRPVSRAALDAFKSNIADVALALRVLREDDGASRDIVIETLGSEGVLPVIDAMIASHTLDVAPFIDDHASAIDAAHTALAEHFGKSCDRQDSRIQEALLGLGGDLAGEDFRHVMDAFVTFPFVDVIAYPLMAMAGVEDLIEVQVARFSPLDTVREGVPTLRSLGLGAFQGFLDRAARRHDMALGRIDGADRLVALLIAASRADVDCPGGAKRLRELYPRKLRQVIDGGGGS